MGARPSYWEYLRLEQLLALQGGLEGDDAALQPDELHFIVVHQVFELWFKLVLRELRLARDHLAEPKVPEEQVPHVVHHLRRVNEIMRHCTEQFGIMETLTPQDFLSFRDKLIPASGFQSFQMREIELLLGLDEGQRVQEGGLRPMEVIRHQARGEPAGRLAYERVEAASRETSLKRALEAWLYRTPINGSGPEEAGDAEVVEGFVQDYLASILNSQRAQAQRLNALPEADAGLNDARALQLHAMAREFLRAEDLPEAQRSQAGRARAGLLFIESYRQLPLLAWPRLLIDAVVELEELFVLWRTRHARMVERVIGRRVGTGGSSGVDYLDATTRYRVFTELWTVRTILVPREALPPVRRAERYGFAS